MIIKGINQLIDKYILEEGITLTEFAALINMPMSTFNKMRKNDKVSKTESFLSLLAVLKNDLWDLIPPNDNLYPASPKAPPKENLNYQILEELRKQTEIFKNK